MQEKTSVMKAQTSQETQTNDTAEATQAAEETALPPTSAATAATAPAHSAETSVSETECIPTQDETDSSAGLQSFSQDFSSSSSADAETEADIATSETAASPSQSDEDYSDEGTDGEDHSDEEIESEDYEARAAADTEALNLLFPSLALTSLGELDAPVRFAELRELGLSVEEAFYASNHRMLAGTVALPTPDERRAGKAHMTTARPSASGKGVEVPPSVLHQAHRIFEGMSDREIASLYKRTAK